jgi:murein DD-endopeptidase MepM/ murein hydrolase activator NlpD
MSKHPTVLQSGDRGEAAEAANRLLASIRLDGRTLHDGSNLRAFDDTSAYGTRQLQAALIKEGALELKTPTGNFGPMTVEAFNRTDAAARARMGIEMVESAGPQATTITVNGAKEHAASAAPAVRAPIKQQPQLFSNNMGVNIPYVTHDKHSQAIYAAQQAFAAHELGAEPLRTPYAQAEALLFSREGTRNDPFTGKRKAHHGIDLVGKGDKALVAPCDGVAVMGTGARGDGGGYGEHLTIYSFDAQGQMLQIKMAHMVRGSVPEALRHGPVRVHKGEPVGQEGSTGRSTGSHLHFEVRASASAKVDGKEDFAQVINPVALLGLSGTTLLAYGKTGAQPEPQMAAASTEQSAAALMQAMIAQNGWKPVDPPLVHMASAAPLVTNLPVQEAVVQPVGFAPIAPVETGMPAAGNPRGSASR